MIGVRVLDYRSKSAGIERLCSVEPAKDRTLLAERNEDVPDRISRKDFAKMKSCIPTVTRFEITIPMCDTQVWVYDEESDMMMKEENSNE